MAADGTFWTGEGQFVMWKPFPKVDNKSTF